MATFKITSKTTVSELKQQFRNEVGGVLRVYEGRSQADDGATLVSLGAKEGEMECRTSRTVGSFEKAFQDELNLKVKVYTKDNWVAVLEGVTLATVKDIPNSATKTSMEAFISNYSNCGKVVNEENQNNMNAKVKFHSNCRGCIPYDYENEETVFVFDDTFPNLYDEDDEDSREIMPFSDIRFVEYGTAKKVDRNLTGIEDWDEIREYIEEKDIVVYYASAPDVEGITLEQLATIMSFKQGDSESYDEDYDVEETPMTLDIYVNDVLIGTWSNTDPFKIKYVDGIRPITEFLQKHNALRYNLNDK